MFDLIVLGLILAGLTAIARVPVPKDPTEARIQPIPPLWTTQTDWSRFHKPTYLRRGVVLDDGWARSAPPGKRLSPSGEAVPLAVFGDAP